MENNVVENEKKVTLSKKSLKKTYRAKQFL